MSKYCIDCKHYYNGEYMCHPKCLVSWERCGGKKELVYGRHLFSQNDNCVYQRNNGAGRCGEEGQYFEQKEEVKINFNIKFKEDDK